MRQAAEVMSDLAAAGLSPAQLALVMELSAALGAEGVPQRSRKAVNQAAYRERNRQRTVTNGNGVTTVSPHEVSSSPLQAVENSAPSGADQKLAVEAWNSAAADVGWPPIRTLSGNRRRSLNARLRETGLDGWGAAIARARASPYLGHDPPHWFTFTWLVKAENFLKLTEGNYDRKRTESAGNTTAAGLAIALDRIERRRSVEH